MIVPFGISSYEHPSLPISAQRCVNLYAEKQPPDAKTPVALLGSPGLVQFASIGDGPIRGMDQMDGVLYAVSGTSLYSVTSSGTGTELGGVISGTGVVSMDNNGSQLITTNGTNGFTYSVAAGFALITDVDFFSDNESEKIPESGCWSWNRYVDKDGYPNIKFQGKTVRLSRIIAKIFHGGASDHEMVCHKCDTPSCVNPNHLYIGTAKDNNTDTVIRGRYNPRKKSIDIDKLTKI